MAIIPNASSTEIFTLTFLIIWLDYTSFVNITVISIYLMIVKSPFVLIKRQSVVCMHVLLPWGAVRHDHILKETIEWLFLKLFLEKRYFFFQSYLNRCHLHIAIHSKHLIEDGFHRHPFHWQSSVFIAHIDHLTAYFPR